jgi:peptide/nickel transport system substrate-binding protein
VLRLTEPDPEFLYKLSLFVYAAAPGVSLGESLTPIPTTGPYMITNYKKGVKELTLVRNPYFKQWSFAARPEGYPDVIHFKKIVDPKQQVADVLAGRADLLRDQLPLDVVTNMARQHPTQVHSDFGLGHWHMWLSTRAAPFDDIRVRKAVNYAVDRQKLVSLLGGSTGMAATCQFLPPNFPGYRPYCPYTLDPHDGGYHGPDLAAPRADSSLPPAPPACRSK